MTSQPPPLIQPCDLDDLKLAVTYLERPKLAARLAEVIGAPVEKMIGLLPDSAAQTISALSEKALRVAMDLAVGSMKTGRTEASPMFHKLATALTGAVGGATGFAGLAVELPVTTTLIFRSIADIARAEGEDIRQPLVCLSCMEVFAFGGSVRSDDTADGVYFATRLALARSVSEAARFLSVGAAETEIAPALVRLISRLAGRFGVVVSYKAAAQLAPLVGAIGGAAVNTLFLDHYQTVAKGHFIVRRLEREYGQPLIRSLYARILHGEEVKPSGIHAPVVPASFEILSDNPTG